MTIRAWWPALAVTLGGGLAATTSFRSGSPVQGGVLAALAIGLAVVVSPLAFPRSVTAERAEALAATDGMPVIYWRPGCQYCVRLRGRLGRHARRAHWVDIWADPAAAGRVRDLAGGFETVPTVVIGGAAHVNPDPALVLRAVTGR